MWLKSTFLHCFSVFKIIHTQFSGFLLSVTKQKLVKFFLISDPKSEIATINQSRDLNGRQSDYTKGKGNTHMIVLLFLNGWKRWRATFKPLMK